VELRGGRALVTGAARRVGQALAVSLVREGARVAVHYNSSQREAEETAELLSRMGATPVLVRGDLRVPGEPERVVNEAAAGLGGLDILVNSAAVMARTPFGEVTVEQWDDMFALNLRAVFFTSQAAAPLMQERGGVIINIADLAAYETWPAYVPHGVTKAGVVQLTRALGRVLAPEVRVNAIAPGAVLLPEGWADAEGEKLAATTPLRRLGSPEDVAAALLYLIRAYYMTGETLIVDGGRHVRG
jgi:pteridine reductase